MKIFNNLKGKKNDDIVIDENLDKKLKNAKRFGIFIVCALIIAFGIFSSIYSVSEQEQAVITQFGKVVGVESAGLHFKIPFIQQSIRVNTTTQGMAIGYQESGTNDPIEDTSDYEDSMMITKDFNFVNIDFYLEYKVANPETFLFNTAEPLETLRNLTKASIRSTISKYLVDEVMTTAKGKIQSEVKDKLIAEMQKINLGIEVVNISIQDAEPPTAEVVQAFKAVETAKQGAETALNNANKYQSEKLPSANADADKILKEAEAYKENRIAEAEGQVARFSETYKEYKKFPLITKKRMFYETLEEVLPNLNIIITDGNTQSIYPVDKFNN
ncbi:HflK protein [Catonella morbi ATCC 51271]|uniref:Protein HflK n=1 Tax=Catonella morbi ATCC 51271 TaxID=592026 RepID=V2Y5W7_9FIRM|nr:FtsH protease activity modulator HflK [Catonella morbi]ESL03492.1 HflK protein [Catonella morbi ATCC 51271]